MVYTPD